MRTVRGVGRELAVLLLGLALVSSGAEGDGGWTNVAGHVLQAAPQAIQGQTVSFKRAGTEKTVDYPLSVFPPGEQERIRVALQDTTVPEGLRSACEFAARIFKRARLLRDHGQTSEEEYRKTVEQTLAAVRQQAAPLVAQQSLSRERLELIVNELATSTE